MNIMNVMGIFPMLFITFIMAIFLYDFPAFHAAS